MPERSRLSSPEDEAPKLGLWDTVSIIIGIVIGAGIYETAPLVFSNVSSPFMGIAVWVLGGMLSFIGALCYAELASTYPRSGGDFVYLSRAYGPLAGFLFGWAQLAVILTGSIGMMAFVFSDYARSLWQLPETTSIYFAVGAIFVLSFSNINGLVIGKRTQNALTFLNITGLLVLIAVGAMIAFSGDPSSPFVARAGGEKGISFSLSAIGLAMIFVLYTYGGWNDAAYVTADVKKRRRNVPLALLIGTGSITLLYVLVNMAYLAGLGLQGARESDAIAADLLAWSFGQQGADVMSMFVMVSALGAVNGLIFTGSRVYAALGSHHSVFRRLSYVHSRKASPIYSFTAQAIISILLVVMVGTNLGRSSINMICQQLGLGTPTWQGHGGFDSLMRCTAPVFWFFFLLTGLALFVLRRKDPMVTRPFVVPLYPLTPLIFCATCTYMLYKSIVYAGPLSWIGVTFLLAGLPLYLMSNITSQAAASRASTAIKRERFT